MLQSSALVQLTEIFLDLAISSITLDILVDGYIKFTAQVAAPIVHIEKRKHAAIVRHGV